MAKPKMIKQHSSSFSFFSNRVYLVPLVSVFLAGIVFLGYTTFIPDTLTGKENQEANQWAIEHWQIPIPAQGTPPETYHPLAQPIKAENCKNCHLDKYQEWSQSLHSQAMGAGVLGQYPHFGSGGKAQCNACHAPMSEQWEAVWNHEKWVVNQTFDSKLLAEGVTCSACHLRNHQRNGPPLREGKDSLSQALHGQPNRTPFFEASEFCKGCHQHQADSFKIDGKTIENTYIEWLESPAYKEGETCQSCHMPDRQHFWKGIHDKEMTKSGVTITHKVSQPAPKIGDVFSAFLNIKNTGTGHMFPTYTTPALFLKAAFLNKAGQVIPGYYEEKIIQRRLNMSTSPWTEHFDTRIAPGESATLNFEKKIPAQANRFKLWVWVKPDYFYEGFFETTLNNNPNHQGHEQLKEALQTTRDRQYSLFSVDIDIVTK